MNYEPLHKPWLPGRGEGRDSHMKGAGMLVVSLRGCKFRILVSLRVSWEKRHYILAVKVSYRVAREET